MRGSPDQIVDKRHDLVAAGNCQRPAGAEVVLQVDDDERFLGHGAPFQFGSGSNQMPLTRPEAEP